MSTEDKFDENVPLDQRVVSELTVILKGEDSTYKQKFLIYKSFGIAKNDPVISSCIKEAMQNFKMVPEEVRLRISLEV